MIPEGSEIAYQCENGHVNSDHDINHAAEEGKQCVCSDCGALPTKTLIPLYECQACGNVWAYTGDADRPTCPDCAGKNTARLAGGEDG